MDEKQYILYLRSINYTGDNIGRDLIFSITLSGYGYKKVEFEKKINQGQLVAYPSFVVYEQRINRSFIQGMVDWIYDQFIMKVAEARALPRERVEEIAQGRVWSGLALDIVR